MTLENARIRAEIEMFEKRNTNVTLKSNIDYSSQNQFLRQRIQQLKEQIR